MTTDVDVVSGFVTDVTVNHSVTRDKMSVFSSTSNNGYSSRRPLTSHNSGPQMLTAHQLTQRGINWFLFVILAE